MVEVAGRVRFEDPELHRPEFLDIHEVLQAASHPSVEQFTRAVNHLNGANYDRFVRLVEVSQEQAPGLGESDLRRLKRQFASLKNTFMLYDVKQSFFEGLAEGFPDGTEEGQIKEYEEEVEKQGAEVKKLKTRNDLMREELVKLIESTSSAFKEFSQQKADTSSQLERLASELADQSKEVLEPLPELGEGPDEEACRVLLANEAVRKREMEDSIASQQALKAELQAAIAMEEQDLHNLESQIAELEAKDIEEVTQDLMARYTDSAEWCDEMIKLTSDLTGISISAISPGRLELELIVSLPDGTTSDPYKLSLLLDTQKGKVQKVDLLPDEIPLKDVIGQQGCDVSKISSMVIEIQARLYRHFAELGGKSS